MRGGGDKVCHRVTGSGSRVVVLKCRVKDDEFCSPLINIALMRILAVGTRNASCYTGSKIRLRGKAPPAPSQFELVNDNHRGQI